MTTCASAEEEIEVRGDDENAITEEEIEVPAERDFPNAFYDPTTGHIMVDPFVNPAGNSYEKSSIANFTSATYYPNRALQSIIQRETELASDSVQGSLRRIDLALQSGWGRLMEKTAFGASSNYKPLPESFYCPITCDLMVDPTIAPDGNSYEREAIENWIRANGMSPLTRIPVTLSDLRPNNALYELIQEEKKRTDATIHPSMRQWKESTSRTSRLRLEDRPENDNTALPSAPPALQDPSQSAPTTSNYPTTEAEIREQMRLRRRQSSAYLILLFFTFLAIILIVPYGFVVVVVIMICLCWLSKRPNRPT